MEYVLQTNVLCKKYQKFTALDNLTMHIPKGAIYGFIGKTEPEKLRLSDCFADCSSPHPGNFPSTEHYIHSHKSKTRGNASVLWWKPLPSIWT